MEQRLWRVSDVMQLDEFVVGVVHEIRADDQIRRMIHNFVNYDRPTFGGALACSA